MTMKHTQAVTCLKCKEKSDFDFYRSINTTLEPELKQRVKNFDIFKFTCPHCGSEQFVAYSFLYHQMEDQLMIYCCQDAEEVEKVRELFAGNFDAVRLSNGKEISIDVEEYRRRIVIGADDLVEKIRIFDAELDDRIVEINKVMLYGVMRDQLAEMDGGRDVDAVFLDEQLDGSLNFVFVAEGRAIGFVPFTRDVYDAIAEQYAAAVEERGDSEPIIDQDWAFAFLAEVTQ